MAQNTISLPTEKTNHKVYMMPVGAKEEILNQKSQKKLHERGKHVRVLKP